MNDLISRTEALKALCRQCNVESPCEAVCDDYLEIKALPSVQPKPAEAARDIATIIENEKDMRVIQERNLMYQRGYEDGFREGRTRRELSDALLPSE